MFSAQKNCPAGGDLEVIQDRSREREEMNCAMMPSEIQKGDLRGLNSQLVVADGGEERKWVAIRLMQGPRQRDRPTRITIKESSQSKWCIFPSAVDGSPSGPGPPWSLLSLWWCFYAPRHSLTAPSIRRLKVASRFDSFLSNKLFNTKWADAVSLPAFIFN